MRILAMAGDKDEAYNGGGCWGNKATRLPLEL